MTILHEFKYGQYPRDSLCIHTLMTAKSKELFKARALEECFLFPTDPSFCFQHQPVSVISRV